MIFGSVFRSRPLLEKGKPRLDLPGPQTLVEGRLCYDFASTSGFGLHRHPEVIAAGCEAFRCFGLEVSAPSYPGSTAYALMVEAERRFANFMGREDALHLASTRDAIRLLACSVGETGGIFIDGTTANPFPAGAPLHRFGGDEARNLGEQLRFHPPRGTKPLVIVHGIVPATGEMTPLDLYVKALEPFAPAVLIVEDGCGLGVAGLNGRGALEHFEFDGSANAAAAFRGVSILSCSDLGHAAGGFGGMIAGSGECIRSLRDQSRRASLPIAPLPAIAASAKALEILNAEGASLRETLHRNCGRLRHGLRLLGLDVHASPSSLCGASIGSAANMIRIRRELLAAGFLTAIVPHGSSETLRFAVSSAHSVAVIDLLLQTLCGIL